MSKGESITRFGTATSPLPDLTNINFDLPISTDEAPWVPDATASLFGSATNIDLFSAAMSVQADVGSTIQSQIQTSADNVWSSSDQTLSAFNSVNENTGASSNTTQAITIGDGAVVDISCVSAQSVTFEGTTGTLKLDDAVGFTGQISGLAGSDALDLSDISFGPSTTASYLGNAAGGTLSVTDGARTANISLVGDYLSSSWTLSSDGHGGTIVVDPVASTNWQTLDVGAGGWLSGIDVAPDGTMVVRTDTYGAYIWNGTAWQQLITSTSMPAEFVTPDSNSQGVYEIQIAPSNSNIMYMLFDGYVFETTNKGATWTETSFAPVVENTSDSYRHDGQMMAIDPENSNVVFVGTPQNGLFETTNGGTTWQSVSAVPVSLTGAGITGILFDPALGTTGGNTNTIFAESNGNGVYESTNGGASWSAIGGPSDVLHAAVSTTGVYYATDGTTLWSYQNGGWSKLFSNTNVGVETVAVDPFNPNEIVAQADNGQINVSYDGGKTWSGYDPNYQFSATDIPWLATTGSWMSIGGTVFSPTVPNELIASAGVGVWTTTLPTSGFTSSTSVTWTSQSAGIEQLVANEIIVPPGGDPVLASWDRPFFYISNANAYPSTYSPNTGSTLAEGWSIDYASSNPNFVVGIADNWGLEQSGYSTNGGQTWTTFSSFIPGAGTNFIGGTIAASSPTNIIWAPAGGNEPYYTLDGGQTWNPIALPGVSSWAGFDASSSLDTRTVTADRVLPNTFYLYNPGDWNGTSFAGAGVYETTDGGAVWTQVYNGQITPYSMYNSELQAVPGEAGNLFFTGGPQASYPTEPFMFSTNGGATWTAVANVTEVNCFGFGAPAPGQSYPSIYIVGYVNNVYGIWQSNDDAKSWVQIGTYPTGDLDQIKTISGDPNNYGQVYVGFAGSGYAYLPASSVAGPTLTSIGESPVSGDLNAGHVVTITLNLSEAAVVSGTPTLTLNDGGTATYTGGSGTNALTFSYTVGASDSNVSALAVTQINLPNGASITDGAGNAANLSLTGLTQAGPQIDTTTPVVSSVVASGSGITNGNGDLNAGHVVTLTVSLSEAVTVAGGTPTLTLNDGGTATYTAGSGSNTLTFSYTVAAGQNTSALAVTAVNLNSATVADAAGNVANLGGAVGNLSGVLQIDTTPPAAPVIISDSPASGNAITLTGTAEANSTVTIYEGTSVLGTTTTNSAGAWSFTTGQLASGTYTFTATATDAAGNVSAMSNPIDPTIGNVTVAASGTSQTLTLSNGTVIVSGSNDTVTLTGNSDIIQLSGNTDSVTISGTGNNVSLTGLSDSVSISGSGTNSITLGTGTATVSFAGGSNTVNATHATLLAADQLTGAGHDTLALTGGGTFTCLGSLAIFSGFSTVTLDNSGSTLNVGNYSLTVNGTAGGNNVITLGSGTDTVNLGTGNDTVTLGTGTATVSFAGGSNTVNATSATLLAADALTGAGSDTLALTGNNGAINLNQLAHFSGFSVIDLSGSNDTLTLTNANLTVTRLSGSQDKIRLGTGVDTVAYTNANESTPTSHDTIVGFVHGHDKIDLTNIAGITATRGVPLFEGKLTGSGNLTLNGHSVAYLEVGGNTEVLVNTTSQAEIVTSSNVSAANMEIVLVGINLGLTATDFHHL